MFELSGFACNQCGRISFYPDLCGICTGRGTSVASLVAGTASEASFAGLPSPVKDAVEEVAAFRPLSLRPCTGAPYTDGNGSFGDAPSLKLIRLLGAGIEVRVSKPGFRPGLEQVYTISDELRLDRDGGRLVSRHIAVSTAFSGPGDTCPYCGAENGDREGYACCECGGS